MNYTEGEWEFQSKSWFIVHKKTGVVISEIYPVDDNGKETFANAHLIASAPDLYEALKEISSNA